MRDYNFWAYIMTNDHDTVLYIGMTKDLTRRIREHVPEKFRDSLRISGVASSFTTSVAQMCGA
jgi:predicted GIY-YIG superfamily endonuclease